MVKPSANLKNVASIEETLLEGKKEELKKWDAVVLIGGANDVYRNETCEATGALETTLNKLKNTNVIVVSIPHRHDLMESSIVNKEIEKANALMTDICKRYENVNRLFLKPTTAKGAFTLNMANILTTCVKKGHIIISHDYQQ